MRTILKKDNIPLIVESFFGMEKIPDIVITTTSTRFFNEFTRKMSKKSFYLTKKISDKVVIIRIPEGISSLPIFKLLGKLNRTVIHLGFCLGVHPSLKPGNIAVVKSVKNKNKSLETKFDPCDLKRMGKSVTCMSVPHIFYAYENREKVISKHIDIIDMETAFVYRYIKNSISINIVTDTLYTPFFYLSSKEKTLINTRIKLVSMKVKRYLHLQ
jgi:hypothetical protein